MLRLAILATAALVTGPAAADPIEAGLGTANKAAEAIILTGPVGALFVLVVVGLVFALAAAGFVIRALWNTIKERDTATVAMREKYDIAIAAVQEKRAAELVESTKQVASTAISGSAAITASNERLADTANRVQTLAERVLPLPETLRQILDNQGKILERCGRGGGMIVKALLAWAGLRASPLLHGDFTPALHSDAVHDALSLKAAVMAGHAHMLRLQRAGDRVAAEGNAEAGVRIAERQTEVRAALDELARRLD